MSERQNDPFAFEGEDDDDKELADVVKERNRLGKALRDANKEVERLKSFEFQVSRQERENILTGKFTEAGVDPRRVRYFSALNPDADLSLLTKEQILAFAEEEGFEVGEEQEKQKEKSVEVESEDTAESGFKPVTPAGSKTPTGVLSREDWLKLTGTDPAAAEAAFRAGKVDLSEVTVGLGPDK